jgi:hypothetical protein
MRIFVSVAGGRKIDKQVHQCLIDTGWTISNQKNHPTKSMVPSGGMVCGTYLSNQLSSQLREAMHSSDVALFHSQDMQDPNICVEFGMALALQKYVILVGKTEGVYQQSACVRMVSDIQEACRVLQERYQLRHLPRVSNLDSVNYSEHFWLQHAQNTLSLSVYLEPMVAGLVPAIAEMVRDRDAIYAVALAAWRAAGSPYLLSGLQRDGVPFAENAALNRWYSEQIQTAQIDQKVSQLQLLRNQHILSTQIPVDSLSEKAIMQESSDSEKPVGLAVNTVNRSPSPLTSQPLCGNRRKRK